MKSLALLTLSLCLLCLPACLTVSGEWEIPDAGRAGGFAGKIGGSYTFPSASGKSVVSVAGKEPAPLPLPPGYVDMEYVRRIFGLKEGEPLPPLPPLPPP